MSAYDEKQKEELSLLFARILHEIYVNRSDGLILDVVKKLYVEAAKLPWFVFRGRESGILKHLEECEVYGVFDFFHGSHTALYISAVFSEHFARWVFSQRPRVEKFISAWPKSRAKKPTDERMARLKKRTFQINCT